MTESDGVDRAVEDATRTALAMAVRGLEEFARQVERLWREAWRAAPEDQRKWAHDTVSAALGNRTGFQAEADAERRRGRDDLGHSSRLLVESDQADRDGDPERADNARNGSERLYDSAERRDAVAEELAAAGAEPDIVKARVLSDTAQGRPGRDAVFSGARAQVPSARRGRGMAGKAIAQPKGTGR